MRFQLAEGESMLLVSDGVVEARNAEGELFGFERTAAISTQLAESIARAASTFGQEDDITVLTLSRAGAEVARA
jgi:serine phosphatase RsbU (regulator of sigma subunit)